MLTAAVGSHLWFVWLFFLTLRFKCKWLKRGSLSGFHGLCQSPKKLYLILQLPFFLSLCEPPLTPYPPLTRLIPALLRVRDNVRCLEIQRRPFPFGSCPVSTFVFLSLRLSIFSSSSLPHSYRVEQVK